MNLLQSLRWWDREGGSIALPTRCFSPIRCISHCSLKNCKRIHFVCVQAITFVIIQPQKINLRRHQVLMKLLESLGLSSRGLQNHQPHTAIRTQEAMLSEHEATTITNPVARKLLCMTASNLVNGHGTLYSGHHLCHNCLTRRKLKSGHRNRLQKSLFLCIKTACWWEERN